MDIYKEFNSIKRDEYLFTTEVSSRVAEGAFMDFGKALSNWRNKELRARAPRFKRKKTTGAGSFRAASGVREITYNGKRRIQLPRLDSVKLGCTLPRSIPHEVRIKRENGRWTLSVELWKEPEPKPSPDLRGTGAVDTGINPLETWPESQHSRDRRFLGVESRWYGDFHAVCHLKLCRIGLEYVCLA